MTLLQTKPQTSELEIHILISERVDAGCSAVQVGASLVLYKSEAQL